jgi:hypothetical protein
MTTRTGRRDFLKSSLVTAGASAFAIGNVRVDASQAQPAP